MTYGCRATAVAVLIMSAACTQAKTEPYQPPALGDPSAPVIVLLYTDFQCAECAKLNELLREFRGRFPGEIQIIFKHDPFPTHPDAELAHEAAIEAGEQGKFWEMHDLLFANQQQLKEDDILRFSRELKLDVRRMEHVLQRRAHRPIVERDQAEARALGISRTPAMFVNGRRVGGLPTQEQFISFVHKLAGTEIPLHQDSTSLKMRDLDLTGSPVRGSTTAKVTIIEFSDFRCAYCARVRSTVRDIVARYDGKVRWVFKNYPSNANRTSILEHKAALAANAQDKFWEMHEALFSHGGDISEQDLLTMARSVGLDIKRFTGDLKSSSYEMLLQRDRREGEALQVKGTPTFFINGQRLVGAAPEAVFVEAIQRAMAQ